MNRLKKKYNQEVLPKLQNELGLANSMAVPKVKKVVISIGLGEAKDSPGLMDKVKEILGTLAGQTPVVTVAKKSVAAFRVSKNQPIGLVVTLRGEKMYSFLDKFMNVVLPKVRDFRGISDQSFDRTGNLNIGLGEQTIFPEVDYRLVDKTRGMAITIVTSANDVSQGKKLLEGLGMPFKKGEGLTI